MALKKVGIEFIAQNAEAYFAAMTKANAQTGQMSAATLAAAQQSSKLDSAMLKLASQITRTSDTIELQKRQYGLLEQALEQTSAKYGENSVQAQKQQLALDRLGASIENNERALAIYHKQLAEGAKTGGKWSEVVTGALRKLGEMSVGLAMEAGSKLVEFFKGSINAAGDFEAAINRFGAVSGTAGAALEKMSSLFLQLGKDTQYSAQQAADAAINLAKGGLEPATIASGALKDTLALAAAGELDLAAAAEVTAKQLGVWSDVGVTSADVANLMAQAANASTVGVEDLALGMANVGDVAKVAGLSFRETVTTMAEIAPGFSGAADAGTAFKTFLTNLTPSTVAATDAFKQLGLMTEDGTNKFYDANGAFVGMQQASQLLASATANLTEEQKKQLLATAFGTDAIRVAARLAENGAAGYLAMGSAMSKAGDATEQAAKRQQGYNYATEQLNGSMETLQIVIGQKLLPTLTSLKLGITEVINGLTQFFQLSDKKEALSAQIVKGAKGWDQYSASIDKVNDQIPWYLGSIEKLNRQQFEYQQSLLASGVSMDEATKRTQALKRESIELDLIYTGLNERSPQIASAFDGVTSQMLLLSQAGGSWKTQANAILEQFRQTGDIAAYTASITTLEQQYQTAQQAIGIEGGGFRATLQQLGLDANSTTGVMGGLADAAMRYANIAPQATSATEALTRSIQPGSEAYKELAKTIEDVNKKGEKAITDLLTSQVNYQIQSKQAQTEHDAAMQALQEQYNSATTEAERARVAQLITDEQTGYADQQRQRDTAYANERMAQQAHLGEMLIEHMIAWGEMNGISKERIQEITGAIATKYGVAKDSVTLSFGDMKARAEEWATSGKGSAETAVQGMVDAQNAAAAMQARMTELTNQAVADLVAQKEAGTITVDEFNAKVAEIPKQVKTEYELEVETQKLIDSAMAAQAEASRHGVEIGTALDKGMAQGIVDWQHVVDAATVAAVEHSAEAAKYAAGIHSPSRLFADEIGRPMADGLVQGFITGVENGTGGMLGALDDLGGKLKDHAGKMTQAVFDEMVSRFEGWLSQPGGGGSWTPSSGTSAGGIVGGVRGRAYGGRVTGGDAYNVAEFGRPEVFVPDRSGYVYPPSSPQAMNQTYNNTMTYQTTYQYAPTYGAAPSAPQYDFMMMEAGRQRV